MTIAGTALPPVTLLTAPGRVGGLETAVAELAKGLSARGVDTKVIQLITPESAGAQSFESLSSFGVDVCTMRGSQRDYLGESRRLKKLLNTRPPGIVHSHGERADLMSRLSCPTTSIRVSTVHGFVVNSMRARVAKTIHLNILATFRAVVSVSGVLAEELSRRLPIEIVHTIPNALSGRALLTAAEARARFGLPATGLVVGWVGRFSEEKKPQLFLHAIAGLRERNITAVLIGDGPLLAQCKALAENLNLVDRCVFAGVLPEAAALFRAFDVFVLSSRTEGTPMTILEAMRAEVPVVATSVGGVTVLLSENAGWLTDVDAVALRCAIDEALTDRDECKRRTLVASERVATQFSPSTWLDRHISLYQKLRG